MSQNVTPSINPNTTSGTDLATIINNNTAAWLSLNSGASALEGAESAEMRSVGSP